MNTLKPSRIVRSTVILAIILLFATASQSLAGKPGSGANMHSKIMNMQWWQNDAIAGPMHLTEAQKDSLEALSTKQRLAMIDLRADVQKAQLIMETSLGKDFNKDVSLQHLDSYVQAKSKFEAARMKMLIETRAILTSEQFTLLSKETKKWLKNKRFDRRNRNPQNRNNQPGK